MWIQNAYEYGWNDGQKDLEERCPIPTAEELETYFNFNVNVGVFKPHQKEQFLKGYRNSIRNGLVER